MCRAMIGGGGYDEGCEARLRCWVERLGDDCGATFNEQVESDSAPPSCLTGTVGYFVDANDGLENRTYWLLFRTN
jgi:hypothetical protein